MLTPLLALLLQAAAPAPAPQSPVPPTRSWPTQEGDFTAKAQHFVTGETMDVRMHYTTLGKPHRDAAGDIDNAVIYQLDASRSYDPWPKLEAMTAPVTWINSADDFINPRGLPFPAEAIKRMPNARFRMIPESETTRGHGTHTAASFWKADLIDLLSRTE